MFKASYLTLAAIVILALTACGRGGMMMGNDQMMDQMQKDPRMMQSMMDQMMSDPKMMQQMMDHMMKNPAQCARMMDSMMKDPTACRLMADQMAKDPEGCRNMMQAIGDKADPAAAQQMMKHCDAMTQKASVGTASSATNAPSTFSGSTSTSASRTNVQEFTVDVGGSGFSPASLNLKKGQPVRISFKRGTQPTCVDEIVFPELKIRKAVPANATTVVEFTPEKEGPLKFACGMNMMKGTLVVQ